MSDHVPGAPEFAVVGRVNKGKSSIIATLAEDDAVAISPVPGTTRECTRFPVQVDGRVLFTLIDTPGFEQATRALAWLEETHPAPHERAARVAALVEAHAGGDEFVEERELLGPILRGAGILYVVDGARPYRQNYESEMEILRWTGQPRLALINRIGAGDHAADWRRALEQYFSVVRDFDAHTASFDERVRLLTTFRELHEAWRAPLGEAIAALETERARREAEVADAITRLLVDELTYTLEARSEGDQPPGAGDDRRRLEAAFHDWLRQRERQARRDVEHLYRHTRVNWEDAAELDRPELDRDLFAKGTWDLLGLGPGQLLALYAVSGAMAGGVLDAFVGGASFGTGAALGALTGAGAAALHLKQRFARATSAGGLMSQLRRTFASGAAYRIGPHVHPNFPFVLLDRALLHWDSVRRRAHARNADETDLPHVEAGLSAQLDRPQREALHRVFNRLRKHHQDVPHDLQQELRTLVAARMDDLRLAPTTAAAAADAGASAGAGQT